MSGPVAQRIKTFAFRQLLIFFIFLGLYLVAHRGGILRFTDPEASSMDVINFAVMTHSTVGMSSISIVNPAGYLLSWTHIAFVFATIVVDVD